MQQLVEGAGREGSSLDLRYAAAVGEGMGQAVRQQIIAAVIPCMLSIPGMTE